MAGIANPRRAGAGASSGRSAQVSALAAEAWERASSLLSELGIEQPFTVEVKSFRGDRAGWMGLFKAGSEDAPVIWINANLLRMMEEHDVPEHEHTNVVTDTILHEIGHSAYRWTESHGSHELLELLAEEVLPAARGKGDADNHDPEEDFCEAFAMSVSGRQPLDKMDRFVARYAEERRAAPGNPGPRR